MQKPPIKVAFVITTFEVAGAELALERYLRQLLPTGEFDVSVCSLEPPPPAPLLERMRELGVPVHTVGMTKTNVPWALLRLAAWLRAKEPRIVCSMMFHPNILCRILRLRLRFPVLLSFERTMGQDGSWRTLLNRLTMPLTDGIVAVSPRVAESCRQRFGLSSSKVTVIPNGVDLGRFEALPPSSIAKSELGLEAGHLVITCTANFRPVKGHKYLLEAFAVVHRQVPHAKLLLVGDGPLRASFEADIRRLELSEHVRLLGATEQVERVLAASDLFVLPSLTEGMSNALLDAMAAGLAVVATDAGGNADVIEDGVCGLLVPPRDSNALAEAMLRLLNDAYLRDQLGTAARLKIRQTYSIEAVAAAFGNLLRSYYRRE
jgi:glycosyltransferase involved in cell wall biosynthesis